MGRSPRKTFQEVKKRLTSLLQAQGRFIFYTDTSIEGTGSSLWQIQEGKPKLIGYASKTLPEAYARYSVTELEMTGLLGSMNMWKNLLKHREFDADHVAVTQILKAKTEPASISIMRLLYRLSAYSFNLYYIKGRDMILADYLSHHRQHDADPFELIPISFCAMSLYHDKVGHEALHVATRSSTKATGTTLPKVHGADKSLNPNLKPEYQERPHHQKLPPQPPRDHPLRMGLNQNHNPFTMKQLHDPGSRNCAVLYCTLYQ